MCYEQPSFKEVCMKNSIVLVLFLFSLSGIAAEQATLLMSCAERFSGLDKVDFYQARDGRIFGVEYSRAAGNTVKEEFKVSSIAFERKQDIELINWFGYERKLSLTNSGWRIDYQDECTSGSMLTECKEYK